MPLEKNKSRHNRTKVKGRNRKTREALDEAGQEKENYIEGLVANVASRQAERSGCNMVALFPVIDWS